MADPITRLGADSKKAPEQVLLHFVLDGFVAFGHVWYRGQELEIEVPSPDYEGTKDRNGENSWIDIVEDDQAQVRRFGHVYMRPGAWPYGGYEAEAAQRAEQQRARRVPVGWNAFTPEGGAGVSGSGIGRDMISRAAKGNALPADAPR